MSSDYPLSYPYSFVRLHYLISTVHLFEGFLHVSTGSGYTLSFLYSSFASALVFDKVPAGLDKPGFSSVMHIHCSLISNSFVFLSVKLFRMNKKGAVKSQDKEIFGNIGLNEG